MGGCYGGWGWVVAMVGGGGWLLWWVGVGGCYGGWGWVVGMVGGGGWLLWRREKGRIVAKEEGRMTEGRRADEGTKEGG